MRPALLCAVFIACLLIPPLAWGAAAASPAPGIGMAGHGGDAGGMGGPPPPLLANVSLPVHTPSAEDWYEQGFALTTEERYSDAVTAYEHALAANRSLLNAWYYLGDALFRLGRPGEALLAFGNATAIDPDFVEAWFYEGRIYHQLGYPEAEKEALGRGLEAAERRVAEETAGSRGTPPPNSVGLPAGVPLLAVGAALLGLASRRRNRDT